MEKSIIYSNDSVPAPQMYNFTSFTVSLNELETGMEKILAPTDCRLRPDIRGMENGNMGACSHWGLTGRPALATRVVQGRNVSLLTEHTSHLLDVLLKPSVGKSCKASSLLQATSFINKIRLSY